MLLLIVVKVHAGEPAASYVAVTVPFTAPQEDHFYRPHQLVTVGIQKDADSTPDQGTFLFDTGANVSCVSATFLNKLGGKQVPFEGSTQSSLLEKPVWSQVPSVQVGGLKVKDVPLRVLPDEQLRISANHRVDGILGIDFCRSLVVHLDFTQSQITFIVPSQTLLYSTLISTPLILPPEEIARQGFAGTLVVPLIQFNGLFWASACLRNQKQAGNDLLEIDSGSDSTLLSGQTARHLKLASVSSQNYVQPLAVISSRNYTDVTGIYGASTAWLSSLQCDGLKLENLLVSYPNTSNTSRVDFNALLGVDVLANYDVLLDFPHRRMYLKPRSDLQAVTSHQYEAASAGQRRQWTQERPIITYPTNDRLDSFAIPYELNGGGLPIAEVRSEPGAPTVPFLLKTTLPVSFITENLAKKWALTLKPGLTNNGKPLTVGNTSLLMATVPHLRAGGEQWNSSLVVLPPALSLQAASGLSLEGVLGANALLQGPLLMDPLTQSWMLFAPNLPLGPNDLKSIEMDDAAMLDLSIPSGDGVPACAVEIKQEDQRHTETLRLATGSPFTLLSPEVAQALKLKPEPQKLKVDTGAGIAVFNQAHVSQLAIGSVVLENVLIAYPNGTMPEHFLPRLGMDVISRLRLLIDTPGKKLYVKKANL